MAKTPSQPRARGKSKPAKAAAARSAASRAKRQPHGDGLRPISKRLARKPLSGEPSRRRPRRRPPQSARLGAALEEKAIAS